MSDRDTETVTILEALLSVYGDLRITMAYDDDRRGCRWVVSARHGVLANVRNGDLGHALRQARTKVRRRYKDPFGDA